MKNATVVVILTMNLIMIACGSLTKTPQMERGVASAPLQDVEYTFSVSKSNQADDAFHFLRSYVDYFYLVTAKNQKNLRVGSLQGFGGWCVGDAHAENFG